jgi:ABC-type multidrug transport system ATPase subunit
MTSPQLKTADLEKKWPGGFHLGPLNLEFRGGETVGILGKNGAGKSTLFEIISGNADKTSGQVFAAGKPVARDQPEIKRVVGYMPQNLRLPRWVTPIDILHYAALLHEIPNPAEMVQRSAAWWDIMDWMDRPLAACSHGMQKRVALALAMQHNPPCVILDEPFETLDIVHVKALEAEIERRRNAGLLTILSTHMAPYAARLCTSVLILERGQMTQLDHWSTSSTLERVELIEAAFTRITRDSLKTPLHGDDPRKNEKNSDR